jgi:class 3 adenylate cyclase/tetratricopeptide (TPR) repeat protein
VECPRCRTVNRDARRYCSRCGCALPIACPACAFLNQPGEEFCGGCGRRQGAEPERRQLTVMFCDLVDSTGLAHRLDPEDLREVIRDYQKCAGEVIARYEGFIARYMGDGMLVYFGYPHAHEDDPARAVHTALEIVDALEQRQRRVRVGIATGLVVVGDTIGEGASEEAAVVGETPNLAARLQSVAAPGSVLVAEATRELAGGMFEYADDGVRELKGFRQPVRCWRVLRKSSVESRFHAAHSRSLTPLVGREREIEALMALWRSGTQGQGHVALVAGEAGIGKSRLAEALYQHIAGEPHIRLYYQCSPYHTNSALYPFIHQLERDADFRRSDSAADRLDKLEALLRKSTEHIAEIAPLYAALLSVPTTGRYPPLQMAPQEQKAKTIDALLDRLGGLAARAPVLFLFEDVHWIDPTSIELLNLGARRIRNIRAFAILTSRTAPDYPWLGLEHVRQIQLERLDRRQAATMVGSVLEGRTLPAGLLVQIVDRTDGVPLFIEEVTKTLAASVSEVPATLQDSLMARLDQLGSAKEVAQTAAVIGREFSRELLAVISQLDERELSEALDKLTSSAVLFGRGQPPWSSFIFKHALMEDAAYASLLRSRRQELHSRLAGALERLYPERVRIEPEVLAHHYTEAGKALQAAAYWIAAAQRALDRSANLETLGHANKGLEVLASALQGAQASRLELALQILRGAAYRALRGFASSDTERSFTRARELCELLEDGPRLIEARRGLFSCYYARGALAAAREEGLAVARLGGRSGDRGSRMLGHWMSGCVAFWQGEFGAARQELEEAFSLYDADAQRANPLALQIDPGVNALFHLSWTLWILGYPDQAVAASNNAIQAARRLAQPFALAMALFFACATRACCGHSAAVRQMLDELIALTTQHGLGYLGSCALVLEGQELIARGECAAGLDHIGRAFSEFQAQEAGVGLPWAMSISVLGYAGLGRRKEGLGVLVKAQGAASRNGERHWEAELMRLKGELLLLEPKHEGEAEACFRESIELARRQGARSLELRAAVSLARLLARQGKRESAQRTLSEVYGGFTEGLDTTDLRTAAAALKDLATIREQQQ